MYVKAPELLLRLKVIIPAMSAYDETAGSEPRCKHFDYNV